MADRLVIATWELAPTGGVAPPDTPPADWSPYYGSGAGAFLTEFVGSPYYTPSLQYRDPDTGALLAVHPVSESPDYQPGGTQGSDWIYGPNSAAVTADVIYVCGWASSSIWKLDADTAATIWRVNGYVGGSSGALCASTTAPVLSADGSLLYVPNDCDASFTHPFVALNTTDGSVASTVSVVGSIKPSAVGCTLAPDGTFVFTNRGTYGGAANVRGIYRLDPATGAVTQLVDVSTLGLAYSSFSGNPYIYAGSIAAHPSGDGFAFTVNRATTGPLYHSEIVECAWDGTVTQTYSYAASGLDNDRLSMMLFVAYSSNGSYLYSVGDTSYPIIWRFARGPGSVGGSAPFMHCDYADATTWTADGTPTGFGGAGRLWGSTIAGIAVVPAACIPPANDDFANAVALTPWNVGSVDGDTTCATVELGEPPVTSGIVGVDPGLNTVWFHWLPEWNGHGSFYLNSAPPHGRQLSIEFYQGSSLGSLVGPISSGGLTDTASFPLDVYVRSGDDIWMRVHDIADGSEGPFTINWTFDGCAPPPNDNFANAQLLSGASGTVTGNNCGASVEPSEPPPDVGGYGWTGDRSIWFRWISPGTGSATFDTTPSDFDTVLTIFTGDTLASLVLVGSNDDEGGGLLTSRISFTADEGVEYHIRVTGYSPDDYGSVVLEWNGPAAPVARNLLPRKPGRGRLGCGVNEAYITWKCGTPRFCPVLSSAEITYSRHLNDLSEATVVVPVSGTSDDECCECLGDLEPWCHELHIARDGKDVWLGPVTEVVYEFDKVTIRALDILGWATVRVSEVDIDYTTTTGAGPADWTTIGQAVLDVAFAEDDPCLLPYVSAAPSGYVGEQKFAAYDLSAFDQLDQLAQTGLEYTVVGRTVILTSPNIPTAPIATLLDDHILGSVQLTKSGLLQADRWFVHWKDDDTAGGPGLADAPDKYCYGLIERIRSTDEALANSASATLVAGVYLAATATAPRLLEIPDGSQLSPEAPWTIDAMIPGVRVDVGITRLCVTATQSFRLAGMQVRQTADGEEITVTLGPLNVLSGGL